MRLQTPRRAVPQTIQDTTALAPKLELMQLLDLRPEELPCFSQEVTSSYTTLTNQSGTTGSSVLAAMEDRSTNSHNSQNDSRVVLPNAAQILLQATPQPSASALPAWATQALAMLAASVLVLVAARLIASHGPLPAERNMGFAVPVMVAPYTQGLSPERIADSRYTETTNRQLPVSQNLNATIDLPDTSLSGQDATAELISSSRQTGGAPPEDGEYLQPEASEGLSSDYPSTEFHTLLAERTTTEVPPPLALIESTETSPSTAEVPANKASAATFKLEGRIEPYRNE